MNQTEEGDLRDVEIKFVHYGEGGFWEFPKKDDQKLVHPKFVFYGPCKPSEIRKRLGYKFKEDEAALRLYKRINSESQ